MKEKGHLIKTVQPGSIAEEMEIEAGDRLLAINGEEVEDIFDYQYMIQDEYVEVLVAKPSGEEWLLEIDKEYTEDLGVEFENGLMDDYRSCTNKCIFCFTRCLRECGTRFILRTTIPGFPFYRAIM